MDMNYIKILSQHGVYAGTTDTTKLLTPAINGHLKALNEKAAKLRADNVSSKLEKYNAATKFVKAQKQSIDLLIETAKTRLDSAQR
ncbi:hypothetical protein, partial [Vibrio alfacsensis]|uniref:hypothetical protein n=1 Tax=Vibrio alfacsensis TaxID=1074311 RepID=UPI00406969C5